MFGGIKEDLRALSIKSRTHKDTYVFFDLVTHDEYWKLFHPKFVWAFTTESKSVGVLYDFAINLIDIHGLIILDPYKDIGHSIFQVPENQTVENTPMEDSLLLNETFKDRKLKGIISIEPQLGRNNPENGKLYAAKLQEVIIFFLSKSSWQSSLSPAIMWLNSSS